MSPVGSPAVDVVHSAQNVIQGTCTTGKVDRSSLAFGVASTAFVGCLVRFCMSSVDPLPQSQAAAGEMVGRPFSAVAAIIA